MKNYFYHYLVKKVKILIFCSYYLQNCPKLAYPDPVISDKKVEGIAPSQPKASTQAYRPPSARNRTDIKFSLDDDDDTPRKSSKITKNISS